MAFLSGDEIEQLAIRRMIFHVVGVEDDEPILLDEIAPPEHADFFLERIKSVVRGNLFAFRERSGTERLIRQMADAPGGFAERSRDLASDFHGRHKGRASVGVFLVFELSTGTFCKVARGSRSPASNASARRSSASRRPCRRSR